MSYTKFLIVPRTLIKIVKTECLSPELYQRAFQEDIKLTELKLEAEKRE